MKSLSFVFGLVLVSIHLNAQTAPPLSRDSIEIEGKYRTFEYFIPQDLKTEPSLVLSYMDQKVR